MGLPEPCSLVGTRYAQRRICRAAARGYVNVVPHGLEFCAVSYAAELARFGTDATIVVPGSFTPPDLPEWLFRLGVVVRGEQPP
jgi:hypothetical protein